MRNTTLKTLHLLFILIYIYPLNTHANLSKLKTNSFGIEKHSVARLWNECLLEAIRNDYARPTVHARNLFHLSVAMFDAWAVLDNKAHPYLLGNTVHGIHIPFHGFKPSDDILENQKKAISYAAYRLLMHRFKNSPNAEETLSSFNELMDYLNYDKDYTSINYEEGNAESLGNYIAKVIIDYGLHDGANEQNNYVNTFYTPINQPLNLSISNQNDVLSNPNRWQPLAFSQFIDQSGNISKNTPDFLSPEWGKVLPFSLSDFDKQELTRNHNIYTVYHLPEAPPYIGSKYSTLSNELYKWNFTLVALWSAHLDPYNGKKIDISPASIGNINFTSLPLTYKNHKNFYNDIDGGDIGKGYPINPITNTPYKTQKVPLGDYARVLAEFWADGPDSETPPGHWFTILNYVNDHELMIKKFNGQNEILDDLEWDVKSYFILGGAMHDAAIATWGIKGWIDYIRPVSAIRNMALLGQSSDPTLENYHPNGIPLIEGYIEVVTEDDELSGFLNLNIGEIKIKSWKGHSYIENPETDIAGVGWILAKNWWPYQRPSFVTPPFAGFVSGHSTFSRAAAEVLTLITGSPYFPGGIGEFKAEKNKFLVFEKGPSVDVVLQWATYRDASDQTSLSRIWGGIHPPADDIPGRIIGQKIGTGAYNFSTFYFKPETIIKDDIIISPNPIKNHKVVIYNTKSSDHFYIISAHGKSYKTIKTCFNYGDNSTTLALPNNITPGVYYLKVNQTSKPLIVIN